ncbi:MAG: damage-control phosphatase ARMT1 family protein [Anaerolineae bacterium]
MVDDTQAILDYLQGCRPYNEQGILEAGGQPSVVGACIDFICDNAGTELLMDLVLTDFLLQFGWAEQVTLHVKAQPTYVSDALVADVEMTIAAMKSPQHSDQFGGLATRLESYRAQSQLHVRPDIFWNSSHFFWEIPPALNEELSQTALVIIKGDANYRRLLGDSRWPTTTPFAEAVPYFPAPFVTLRTLKSDPIVGLPPGLAEQLDQIDAEWRVNGQRGVIQFVK